ncbi:sigma-70 family RNA polymerase sigma factor [Paenibacillus sp. JNUCC31]|uniref:RNA polymerase sigma factor n=1 Tax=Paenibacillus sp. JNUCC-31 TaxID=2777983 RepID=UPI00177D9AAC|nr:RNA polymerase sigma factor [Paenibacillus sp. JNUCC-31]QOS77535.1 sigma-70 family RNA polymerase sigma factor [Paenibacillus sp. JNUCC-31]
MAFVKSVDCRINRPHENKRIESYSHSGVQTGYTLEQTMEAALPDLLGSLYAYCMSLTGSVWETEDLVQDTCVKVLSSSATRRTSMTEDMNWEAYLIRVARNTWIDAIRKRETLASKLESMKPLMQEYEEEGRFEEVEFAVQILVDELPPWQRAIYMLRDLMGYTTVETAELLDTTEGAVKAALSRARSALAKVRHSLNEPDSDHTNQVDEDQQNREELRSYLLAFRSGDTARLIDLCLNQTDDPMAVAGTILQQTLPSQSMQPVMYSYSCSDTNSMSYGGGYTVSMVA